jgi:hypothetical protein
MALQARNPHPRYPRTLTPEELAELLRAQQQGGIPNIRPDISTQVPGQFGDLPSRGDQRSFQQRTTGYPQGGVRGILDRIGTGISEDVGQAKEWLGGLLTPQTRSGSVEAPVAPTSPSDPMKPQEEMMSLLEPLDPELPSLTDQIYDAIFQSEHRSDAHRSDPWIRTTERNTPGGSSAYGPLQITRDFMVRDSKHINPTKEEQDYIDRYIEQGDKFLKYGNEKGMKGYHKRYDYGGKGDLSGAEDQAMYKQVATKLLDYYIGKYKDPETVASKWRFGPNTNKKVSKHDKKYWAEFKRVMGL